MQSPKQELQAIMVEVEGHKRQMDAIRSEMQMLESTKEELQSTIAALSALRENKPGTGILVSVGSGSFLKAQLKDTENAIIGVGGGLSIEKKADEAKKLLEERSSDVSKLMEKLENNAEALGKRLMELDGRYRMLMGELQGGQR